MGKLWGGRFSKPTDKLVEEFTKSIHFDYKLAEYDVLGSIAHVNILKKAGLLTTTEHKKLKDGLERILKKIKAGHIKYDNSFEDIHSFIQYLLEKDKSIGKAALKLHTCRSRNDQVVFGTKIFCFNNIIETLELIRNCNKGLLNLAKKNANIYIPGYTHLQHAIPISLAKYLHVYCTMLHRDFKRLKNAYGNIQLTMGAGALAGTMIKSTNYNQATKSLLGEDLPIKPTENSLDTVSDRDFIIEILSTLSLIGMHLSRFAEDMILWATKEFDFIDIDESFCTGSSLMPQKKNPDVLELIRGNTGRLYGNLINVMVMMKGLPLSYNRDMQLDKEPLFDSFKIIQDELKIMTELLKNIRFKKENIDKQLDDECLYATDLADFLVQQGVPFKEAHLKIGKLIQDKLKKDFKIRELDDNILKKYHPLLTPKALKRIINPKQSVLSKKSVKRVKR